MNLSEYEDKLNGLYSKMEDIEEELKSDLDPKNWAKDVLTENEMKLVYKDFLLDEKKLLDKAKIECNKLKKEYNECKEELSSDENERVIGCFNEYKYFVERYKDWKQEGYDNYLIKEDLQIGKFRRMIIRREKDSKLASELYNYFKKHEKILTSELIKIKKANKTKGINISIKNFENKLKDADFEKFIQPIKDIIN